MSDDVRRITFIYLVEVSSVDNIRCNFFLNFFEFVFLNPLKSSILISYTQNIYKFCSTVPLESSITFLNLVLAVLKWAVGRFKNGNRRLYKESRAKLKHAS